jgi:hypothetical protein
MRAHMSHQASPVVHPEHDVCSPGDIPGGISTDNQPTGTYNTCEQELLMPEPLMAYVPAAFFVRTSITSSLSATFHLLMFKSVFTTNLI